MKTKVTSSAAVAAREIRNGNIAAFPTETVYGLGANAFNESAVKKIFLAKNRPADNPLIVHIWSKSQFQEIAPNVNPKTLRLVEEFFPGPLSVVVKKSSRIPAIVTAGLDTVCVRMPSLAIARKFLRECGVPVAAPSANVSGIPSPTSWKHVLEDMNGKIPLILKGPDCEFGLESTVISCAGKKPVLLRPGAVSLEEIENVIGKVSVSANARKALSPGMLHRHYCPKAKVVLVSGAEEVPEKKGARTAFIGFESCSCADFSFKPRDNSEYAQMLYSFLRESDSRNVKTIYAQLPDRKGFGLALRDRLSRASNK